MDISIVLRLEVHGYNTQHAKGLLGKKFYQLSSINYSKIIISCAAKLLVAFILNIVTSSFSTFIPSSFFLHFFSPSLLLIPCLHQSIRCLSVCLSVCSSISVCLSVFLSVCRFVCLSVCLYVCPSVYLCVCICLSVCLSVCLSFYLPVSVFVFPSACSVSDHLWYVLAERLLVYFYFSWTS